MAKNETVLALDIGADSIKAAEFTFPHGGGMILEKFAFIEYGGDLKEEELAVAMKNAMRTTLTEKGFQSSKIYVSISGQSTFIRFVKLPPIGEKEERVRQVVEYEAKQNVPYPIEQVVWDYQLIGGVEAGAEIEVMFVVVKDSVVEEITNTIEELKKEVIMVDVAPAACYNSARANEVGGQECVMLLNIGSRCSSLVFIDSGRFFVRPIPIAGHAITQQISKEFSIPFGDAEELKRKHGFVALGGAYEEPDSEVAATISKIIRNVMTKLYGEVNRSINSYRSLQKGNKPVKLYLSGGSSVMAFTPRFFSEKLKIPCEYFNPFQVVSLSHIVNREELAEVAHMFSEVIGLGLRCATVCPIEISLVPQKLRRLQEIKHKTPYFYLSAASMVLCLTLVFLTFLRDEKIDKRKMEISESVVNTTSTLKTDVHVAMSKLETVKLEYSTAGKILQARSNWIKLLEEIQSLLPDNMWITSIGAGAGASSETSATANPTAPGGGIIPAEIFKKKKTKTAAATIVTKMEWLEIRGYFITLKGSESSTLEQFKENVSKSPLFAMNKDEIQPFYVPAKGYNNIPSFKVDIKLKEPINL